MFKDGLSFFSNTNTVIISSRDKGKKIAPLGDVPPINASVPWSLWGDDNDAPAQMRDDIKSTSVLSGGIHMKVRMAIGKGIAPYFRTAINTGTGTETLEPVLEPELLDWFEANDTFMYTYKSIYNQLAYGWGATQIMRNMDCNYVNRIQAPDIFTCRLEKKDIKNNVIANLYLCSDWQGRGTFDANYMRKVPVLEEGYELQHLNSLKSGFEYVILHRLLTDGAQYYPAPLWKSSASWVKISRSIPLIKEAIHENQMTVKHVILIDDVYWTRNYKGWGKMTQEETDKIVSKKHEDINKWLTGQRNAGKTIIAGKYIDQLTKQEIKEIEIVTIDDKWKDGKMLPDNAVADKQILFSMLFNPAILGSNLLGDGASGGAGSGSDIREAFLVLLMLMETERQMNNKVFNLVKRYNNWTRFETPGKTLVFRYDTSILTTLDTGGSLKQKIA